MAPIFKVVKAVFTRKTVAVVETPPMSPQSAAAKLIHHMLSSVQHCIHEYIRPYIQGKSQAEILFLTSIFLTVLLFVVIIPTFEALAQNSDDDVIHEHSHRVVNVVSSKVVRSSTGSVSSMDTIEESEEEDNDEHDAENHHEEREALNVQEDEDIVEGVQQENCIDAVHEPQEHRLHEEKEHLDASVVAVEIEIIHQEVPKESPNSVTAVQIISKDVVDTLNISDVSTSTLTTIASTSDDESSSQKSDETIETPISSPPSSPPASPTQRPVLKKMLSLGSSFKTTKAPKSQVRRLSETFMRLNSLKSIAASTVKK